MTNSIAVHYDYITNDYNFANGNVNYAEYDVAMIILPKIIINPV